jgi:hypothetical protein
MRQYVPAIEITDMNKFTRIILAGVLLLTALHALAEDSQEERWNAYGQFTYIWHQKESLPAAYTNVNGSPNSLVPEKERSYTTTVTAFLGLRAWKGAEVYFVPEMISELPLSNLHGLGEERSKGSHVLPLEIISAGNLGLRGRIHSGGVGPDATGRVSE